MRPTASSVLRETLAEIDHANVQALTVLHHPVEGGQHVARATQSVFIEDAHVNYVGSGGHTSVIRCVTRGSVSTAGGDARDSRSMSVSIARALAAAEIY